MASNIDIQKKCEWCGVIFTAHKTSTAYCSHRCANLAYKERVRKKRVQEFQLKLQWSDFEMGPDQGYYIRICTEKTETEATLPISHEALELCGEWGKGLVFKGLTRTMTHYPLKQWIAEAGIKKKITFHLRRHSISSFALKTNGLQNFNLRQVTIWKRAKFPYLSYSALLKRTLNSKCKDSFFIRCRQTI